MTQLPKRHAQRTPPVLTRGLGDEHAPREHAPPTSRRARPAPAPISFHRPALVGTEAAYVAQAIRERELSGNGSFTARCQAWLADALAWDEGERPEVLLTASCTTSLELAAELLKDGSSSPGEVILPSFGFVSTANAFLVHGFRPVFADIRVHDGNLDPESVARAITSRTRAIVPVHYAGVPGDMAALDALARPHGIAIVEDAGQALFARYQGRPAGTLGELGSLSFHSTKNVSCGEGGALVVNVAHHRGRARLLLDHGTDGGRSPRGEVDKYTWVERGGSYRPSELQAAYLLAQLERADRLQARRRALCERYRAGLSELERAGHLTLPHPRPDVEGNDHIQWILLSGLEERTRLMAHLARRRIDARTHYTPLHLAPMGRPFGRGPGSLPVAERFGESLLRLPLHAEMIEAEADRVVEAIQSFFRPGARSGSARRIVR